LKIAIVDDEESVRTYVKENILKYSLLKCLSIECDMYSNGSDFLSVVKEKKYDIIFLDIFMNHLDGIQTAEILRKTNVKALLIFLTQSSEHRAEAFLVHAFDYLEKPLCSTELERVLNDALELLMQKRPYIDLPVGRQTMSFLYSDILYVTSDSNYLVLYTDREYRCRMSFHHLESVLTCDSRFLTINRGVLVNLDHVTQMENLSCQLTNGCSFPVNKKKEAAIKQAYIARQFALRMNKISKGGII